MLIAIEKNESVDTDSLTLPELKQLEQRITAAADLIQHQIDMAKANRIQTGEYADAEWFARATYALKRKRKDAQALREMISMLVKAEREQERQQSLVLAHERKSKQVSERSLSEYFVDICKERMSPEVFAKLLKAAEKRRAEAQAEMLRQPRKEPA